MKRISGYLFLLGTSLVIIFCIGEIIVRTFLPRPQTVKIRSTASLDQVEASTKKGRSGGVYLVTDTGLHLRTNMDALIENNRISKSNINIRTNSIGYRNREIGEKKGTRILFLGDSITFGYYLPEKDTFVRLVEEIANSNGDRWETINAGVGAVNLQNEVAILKETGISTKPDVVVLGFYLNDHRESLYTPPVTGFIRKSRLVNYILKSLPIVKYHFYSLYNDTPMQRDFDNTNTFSKGGYKEEKAAFDSQTIKYKKDWGGAWSAETWKKLQPHFEELKMLASKHDFKLYFVIFPVADQVYSKFLHDYPQRKLMEIGEVLGTPVLDILSILREQYEASSEQLFYDSCHHTPLGNRIIAANIYRFIKQHLEGHIEHSALGVRTEVRDLERIEPEL